MAEDPRRLWNGITAAAVSVCATAAAAVPAVMMPLGHDLLTILARLGWWLALAAAAWGFTALAVARTEPTGPSASAESRTRRLRANGLLATALLAQLLLITARAARGDTVAAPAVAGGLLLALVALATWRAVAISTAYGSGFTPSEGLRIRGAFGVTVVCGAWLTVRAAAQGPLWWAWLAGTLLVGLAALFWLLDDRYATPAEKDDFLVFASAAAAGVVGVVIDAFVRGDISAPGPVLIALVAVLLFSAAVTGAVWGLRGRTSDAGPLGAQLAGLAVPLGSVVGAAWEGRAWDTAPVVLRGVSELVATAVVLLVLQTAALRWLDTAPSPRRVEQLVRAVRDGAHHVAELREEMAGSERHGGSRYSGLYRYERDRYRYERERDPYRHEHDPYRYGPDPYRHERDPYGYERERALREREMRERGPEAFDLRLGPYAGLIPAHGMGTTVRHLLAHPLLSAPHAAVHRDAVRTTGLAVDVMWPRVELVASPTVRRRVRRPERRLLTWRLIAASALCTAAVWTVIASLTATGLWRADALTDPALTDPALLAAVAGAGPLLLAAFAVAQARRQLVETTAARAQAVDVLRYDLARTMQLELPEDTDGMILLAPALSGERLPGSPPVPLRRDGAAGGPDPRPATGPADPDRLRRDIREDLRAEVRSALRDANATPAPHSPTRVTLQEEHLSRLAQDIARNAAEPVGNRLKDQLSELRQSLRQEMGDAVRTSIEETVTGPPLTNFLGYLAIEPDRRTENPEPPPRAEHGTLKATAGSRINLMLSVVRDRRAQNTATLVAADAGREFFVYEPIRIEGGREATSVPFDAMVDSSTLTPLPQRKSLSVAHEVQTPFGFRLPDQPGTHEVWFQLYQAGRLIQVAALKIEAEAPRETPQTPQAPGEDTDGG
ncbi:hypothetical protein [Streptomyces sp. NPDC052012]|uniref:hypothetical protein n=1 Tax=Streptomyces sp. NPDC052012 TaxID=3155051 RepID=UPI00344B078B